MGDVRDSLRSLGLFSAKSEKVIAQYDSEIARVMASDLLDKETKKEVVAALKGAKKIIQSAKVDGDRTFYFPPPFVVTDKREKNPSLDQITTAYQARTGISFSARDKFRLIFSEKGVKKQVENGFEWQYTLDPSDTDRIERYNDSQIYKSLVSRDHLKNPNNALKRGDSFNFGSDGFIGVSTEAKLDIALGRIRNITDNINNVVSDLQTNLNYYWRNEYVQGNNPYPEQKAIEISMAEQKARAQLLECGELFKIGSKEKISDFLKKHGFDKAGVNSPEVQFAFDFYMGFGEVDIKKLTPDQQKIAKQIIKFGKDKENDANREEFVRGLIEFKIEEAKREKQRNKDTQINMRAKAQKDFENMRFSHPNVAALFDQYLKEKDAMRKQDLLDKILYDEPYAFRKTALKEILEAHDYYLKHPPVEQRTEFNLREIETEFGVIDTAKIIGQKEIDNLEAKIERELNADVVETKNISENTTNNTYEMTDGEEQGGNSVFIVEEQENTPSPTPIGNGLFMTPEGAIIDGFGNAYAVDENGVIFGEDGQIYGQVTPNINPQEVSNETNNDENVANGDSLDEQKTA